ncbi:MAG: cell division protein FtsQ [Saprospiraceae bacterium]|jgi:cell division protein FtsQ
MESKKTIKIVANVLGIIGLLVCFGFAIVKQEKQEVKSFSAPINVLEGDPFLGENDIKAMVTARLDTFLGKSFSEINLLEIERLVELEAPVKNAEVYLEVNGNLKVEVSLKTVIVRVKPNGKKGYYIDKQGDKMSWVSSFTPRVLTVSGWLNRYLVNAETDASVALREKLFFSHLYDFSSLVYEDEFWSKQIVQVYINDNGDAELVCLVGNQKIVFGALSNSKVKLEKLKMYYEQVVNRVGWNKYKEINLKFENQIVCK